MLIPLYCFVWIRCAAHVEKSSWVLCCFRVLKRAKANMILSKHPSLVALYTRYQSHDCACVGGALFSVDSLWDARARCRWRARRPRGLCEQTETEDRGRRNAGARITETVSAHRVPTHSWHAGCIHTQTLTWEQRWPRRYSNMYTAFGRGRNGGAILHCVLMLINGLRKMYW